MGVTLPTCAVINYICAVIKPRLRSDKTGFYSLGSVKIIYFRPCKSDMLHAKY